MNPFSEDPSYDICKRTKVARAACRRISQSHTLRATKFCDLVTADHQVFCAEGESRSDQRYALVVQDLATQWIQSYPCKTQISEETTGNLWKFLDPGEKPKAHIH